MAVSSASEWKEPPQDVSHGPGGLPEDVQSQSDESPGVKRIELISSQLNLFGRIAFFLSIWLITYVYGLDGQVRYTYQPYATASYGKHSLISTVDTLRAVIAAAAQPTAAKIADMFGRVELIFVSVFFYTIGTAVEASATTIEGYAGGAVLYQIGYTGIMLLVEVLIADVTSTRSRLLFSYIPATPFIINTWISGDVTESVLKVSNWQWGIGMFAIILPVCSIPLLITMLLAHRKAKKINTYPSLVKIHGVKQFLVGLFWRLDVVGIILLIAVFALILVPFTIAKGEASQWATAKIIGPMVIGVLCVPAWIMWERWCPYPMVPFRLLKDRAVYGALGIAVLLNTAWSLQGQYLFTVLSVAFDESTKSATRITALYSFCSVITGCTLGFIVLKVRRLKPFIVAGTCIFTAAFGILIHFRGGSGGSSHSGIIGGQILLGIAGGMFPYPAQASIQVATKHERLAVITAVYLSSYNIGSALGGTIAGAIWAQTLPKELNSILNDPELVNSIFQDPFTFIANNPIGTPTRDAVVLAYMHTQRILCIVGICLTVPLIISALCIRNPKLTKDQSLPDAEKDSLTDSTTS